METASLRTDDGREEIVRRYSDMVYRLACAQVRSRADAEDLYQEVFLRLFDRQRAFASEEHRKAWLIRVTVNCARKFWASAWVRHTVPLKEDLPFSEPEDQMLWEQLQKLPGPYRAVLHLFYYEDLGVAEIARLLQRKPATVRTQLTRARRALRKLLEEEAT